MKQKAPLRITSRSSSLTNGFVQAILPNSPPTSDQYLKCLAILGIDPLDITCVYCGKAATDWDHLRPIVKAKRPTGFLTNYRNLVPACGRCNQSKGGYEWRVWMTGTAKNSPTRRGIKDLTERIEILERYEAWGAVQPIDFCAIAGNDVWAAYWAKLEHIQTLMQDAQRDAATIRDRINKALFPTPPQ